MNIYRLVTFLFGIVIFCVVIIYVVANCLPIDQNLKFGIISEVIGGGLLGGVVAVVIFYLQESGEYHASKTKTSSLFKNKLIPDILEARDREETPWNFRGENKFYFDGSLINPLFDVYQSNVTLIYEYEAYFPKHELIDDFNNFYKLCRRGYVIGEKIQNLVYQFVRSYHYQKGLIPANDYNSMSYINAKLVDFSEVDLFKHLGWQPDEVKAKDLSEFINNEKLVALVKEYRTIRKKLLGLQNRIIKLAEKSD